MTRVVAILSAYGLVTMLPIFFVFQPFLMVDLPGIPIRFGDLLDLMLTPWIGVGVFALLYVFIPKASESSTGHKNLHRVLFWTFSVSTNRSGICYGLLGRSAWLLSPSPIRPLTHAAISFRGARSG